jgi:hypothetical protein
MGTTRASLSSITKVVYNGNEVNIAHFGNACTWAKKCFLYIAAVDGGFGRGTKITVKRIASEATLGTIKTLKTISVSLGYFSTQTISVYYGDTIEITTTSTTYGPASSTFVIKDYLTDFKFIKKETNTISFYLDGYPYATTKGTTWKTYAENTANMAYNSNGDFVYHSTHGPVLDSNGNMVSGSAVIQDGAAYYYEEVPGGGGGTPDNPGTGGDTPTYTFSVNGVNYYDVSSSGTVTWSQLANSNSDFTISGDLVIWRNSGPVAYTNGDLVSPSSTITLGYSYIIAD